MLKMLLSNGMGAIGQRAPGIKGTVLATRVDNFSGQSFVYVSRNSFS